MIQSYIAILLALAVTIVPYATASLDEIFGVFETSQGSVVKRTRPEVDRVVGFESKGATIKTIKPKVDMSDLGRVVGGTDADPTRYPFFTDVEFDKTYSDGEVGSEFCAGSLIAPDVVITAAQCFIEGEINFITVRVNSTSVNATGYDYVRDVSSWEVHPQFDEVSFDNDVAVLFLSTAVTEVTPLVLNADAGVPADGADLELIGLGTLSEEGDLPEFLQVVTLQSIPALTCAELYSTTTETIDALLQLCAAADGKDACAGDSGAPLLLNTESGFLLVGLSSFGISCADPVSVFSFECLVESNFGTL